MRPPFFDDPESDPAWYAEAPREGIERKERSETRLCVRRVPIYRHLPRVETEAEANFRPKEEIVKRIVALTLVAVKGEGALTEPQLQMLIHRFAASDCFSPKERTFIADHAPAGSDRAQFSWRYESLWILLWSIRLVPLREYPDAMCDVPRAVGFLRDLGREGLLEKAALRSGAELLDSTDFAFRCHWAVRDAQLTGKDIPGNLDPDVVLEWHYALNWLVQTCEWDEVDTST